MFIGKECFTDTGIITLLNQDNVRGDCEFSEKTDVVGYDTNSKSHEIDLADSFYDILSIYRPQSELPKTYPKQHLDNIENHISNIWSVFSSKIRLEDIKVLLKELCKDFFDADDPIFNERVGIPELNDVEYLKEKSLIHDKDWMSFVESIKSINRFHSDHINLKVMKDLFDNEGLQRQIKNRDNPNAFLRGRICNDNKMIPPEEMGAPPKRLAPSGRVNSKGIRCLYLTTDEQTLLHEIRARDHDYVTIAEFAPKKALTLVDLTKLDRISPFGGENSFDAKWFAINIPIIREISHEISKPLMRNDSEIDYLPTQYISDFIKQMGFDGICYNSTLMEGGENYAIFDPGNFRFEREFLIRVKPVDYDYDRIDV